MSVARFERMTTSHSRNLTLVPRIARTLRRAPVAHRLVLAALLACVPATVHALDVSGVHLEDRITLDGAQLVLNGAGVRHVTIFGIEVYVAGLYVPSRTSDVAQILRADQPRQILLVMKRDVGHDQIGPAFRDAAANAAGSRAASLRSELDAFGAWIPAMRAGDRFTVSYTPAADLVVTSDGAPTTFRGSAELADAVFRMWIGERPVEDSLRAGLLGR